MALPIKHQNDVPQRSCPRPKLYKQDNFKFCIFVVTGPQPISGNFRFAYGREGKPAENKFGTKTENKNKTPGG